MMTASRTVSDVAVDLIETLSAWTPNGQRQKVLRDEYVSFVRASPRSALDRDEGSEHVTASCFVFTADLGQVLLCFHKKGQFWVQLGGHVEATDVSIPAAALREAREEGGIDDLRSVGGVLDVDRHTLGGGFTRCSVHWDIGFGAVSRTGLTPSASSESEDVAWWPVTGLPDNVPPNFGNRVLRILDEIRNQSDTE